MKHQEIQTLLEENKLEEALVLLDRIITADSSDSDALFLRGKLYWRQGNRPRATSDYAAAAALDPESPATQALEHAREIEAFFNPDLLNP